jgi:hypothetical protein
MSFLAKRFVSSALSGRVVSRFAVTVAARPQPSPSPTGLPAGRRTAGYENRVSAKALRAFPDSRCDAASGALFWTQEIQMRRKRLDGKWISGGRPAALRPRGRSPVSLIRFPLDPFGVPLTRIAARSDLSPLGRGEGKL